MPSRFRLPALWPGLLLLVAAPFLGHCAEAWQCRSCSFSEGLSYRLGFYDSERVELAHETGIVYRGGMENAMAHGRGTMELPPGYRISGLFERGFLRPGPGSFGFPDGNEYGGAWEFRTGGAERHKRSFALVICLQGDCSGGRGVLADQFLESVYVGAFRAGDFHGRGALFWQYRLIEVDGHVVEIAEQDYFIYAGNFQYGELKDGTLYCLRHLQFCGYLYGVLRGKADAPRVARIDSFGFFQNRLEPRLSEFTEGARYLISLN